MWLILALQILIRLNIKDLFYKMILCGLEIHMTDRIKPCTTRTSLPSEIANTGTYIERNIGDDIDYKHTLIKCQIERMFKSKLKKKKFSSEVKMVGARTKKYFFHS